MLNLITAVPGSGKTLLAMQFIFKHLNEGRRVYSNIDGLKIAEVLPMPFDWRDLPNNSVCVIDEAQEHPAYSSDDLILNDKGYPDKKRMAEVRDIARALQIHRHFGFDIYLITQDPTLLERKTLALVGMHYHLYRAYGLARSTLYQHRVAQNNPDAPSVRKACETVTAFKFPKYLYHYYESATQHTHKINVPWHIVKWGVISVAVMAVALNTASNASLFGLNPFYKNKEQTLVQSDKSTFESAISGDSAASGTAAPAQQQKPVVDEAKRVASVFATEKSCRAYNTFGNILTISLAECFDFAENPYKLQAGDITLKEERLRAINYSAQATTGTATTVAHNDGVVSLN